MSEQLGINKQIAKGATIMVVLRLSIKSIGLVSTFILARLLTPEDFGLVALAMSVYVFVELIRAFGFDTALIQNQNADEEHYSTAWSMQVIFACISALIIFFIAPFIGAYYGDERLITVLRIVALISIFHGLENIGVVEFRKQMTFAKEFRFQIFKKISSFLVTIPLAFYLANYWALLAGMLTGSFVSMIISYTMQEFRPRFTLVKWKELLSFSSWLLFNNFLFFINNHSQNFIIGKLSGQAALGNYKVSNEIATLTTVELIAPINRAAYPGYSKLKSSLTALKESYLKVQSNITLLAMPSAFGLALVAHDLVPVVLGEKWLDTIELIELIAISSIFVAITTNSSYIYIVLGKPKITTYLMLLRTIIFLPLMFYFVGKHGAYGVALAIVVVEAFLFPFSQFLIFRYLKLRFRELIEVFFRPTLSIMAMCIAVLLFDIYGPDIAVGLSLIIKILIGGFVFVVTLFLSWLAMKKPNGVETDIVNMIIMKLKLVK